MRQIQILDLEHLKNVVTKLSEERFIAVDVEKIGRAHV